MCATSAMDPSGKKRESEDEASDEDGRTPVIKRSRTLRRNGNDGEKSPETPTKARRGRPPGSGKKQQSLPNNTTTAAGFKGLSLSNGKPSTPNKARTMEDGDIAARIVRNADNSARRKSARNLLDRMAANEASEGSDIEDEDILARKIWEADEEAASSDQAEEPAEDDIQTAVTPSKRKPGRRKKRSPTPPINLPPHEQYFWQNRPGRVKTSNNTLSSLSLLSHEQYHNHISAYKDPHASSHQYLHSLHRRSFPQWRFELSECFNICLYGYGSKRSLVTDFAHYLHHHLPATPKIFMVSAYTSSLTLRSLLINLAPLVYDCPAASLPKLPTQPRDLLSTILAHLASDPSHDSSKIHILVNSLDAAPLRRGDTPALLAQLAAHPSISLFGTCDTPNFPLLWDVPTRDRYNFLFHDATTFISYASVESTSAEVPDVVDTVNELLGRSGRTIKGKEGVGFVLRSLPENARNLYRILISEILAGMDSALENDIEEEEDDGGNYDNNNGSARAVAADGIEYKILYQKTVEEFICSNEMGFRQLLKEFWDHDMIVSKRENAVGGEVLGVPWRREEMEAILEELLG